MKENGKPAPDCNCVWRLINRELLCDREENDDE